MEAKMHRLALILMVLFVGCNSHNLQTDTPGRQEIIKVFLHTTQPTYSAMSVDAKTKRVTYHYLGEAEIYADVSPGEPMWVEWDTHRKFKLHIRANTRIEGGETGGKHSTKTNLVE